MVLVVLGLMISIPIVVWGSTLILGWMQKFPNLLYVGGAVLAWTAAQMIVSEPLFANYLAARPVTVGLIYVGIIGGVLGIAWLRNREPAADRSQKEAL